MNELVKKILNGIRPDVIFEDSNNFIDDGLLDSFDMILLVNDLEGTFNIKINGDQVIPENFISISAIARLLIANGAKGEI